MKNIFRFVIGVLILGSFSCFNTKSKEDVFWAWFVKNSSRLFHFEDEQEKIFDEITVQLRKINPDLTFEFGPIQNDKREFIISAGGIKSSFPAVEKLYSVKPDLKEWKITKFRPRRDGLFTIQFLEKKVSSEDIRFLFFKDDDKTKIGILLFLNGYTESESSVYEEIAYLFLDQVIGEYDVETYIGAIEIQGFDSKYFDQSVQIDQLAPMFDREKINIPRRKRRGMLFS